MPEVNVLSDDFIRDLQSLRAQRGGLDSQRNRRRRPPIPLPGGGGCETQNTILDITVFGTPTGGSFDVPLEINGVTETMTFNYNWTSSQVATELATHSELVSTDVAVTGGAFPSATMRIEFIGTQAGINILPPVAVYGSLTGGSGRGVIIAQAQRGHE